MVSSGVHRAVFRNWHKMNAYVEKNKFFSANVSSGVDAVRKE